MPIITFLRQFRINDYAIFDLLVAFFGIFLVAPLLSKLFLTARVYIPKKNWLFLTLPIGITVHALLNTSTKLNQDFFSPYSQYLLKFIIFVLVVLGLTGVKITKKS